MACAILEVAEVVVLVGDVLEAEAVLLGLAGQVGVPVTQVESPTEVPDDVLIGLQLEVHAVLKLANHQSLLASAQVDVE